MNRKELSWTVAGDGCWLCTSHAPNGAGYPCLRRGRVKQVSRFVWEQHFGPIPAGHVVRHTCDTPACINPAHLTLGTHADNVADRVRRGRSAAGVKNGRAKLTPEKVRLIRASAESIGDLARRFGVDPKTVRKARAGKTWRSV